MIKEQEENVAFSHESNESRLKSYYKSDYSFRMESLLIAMRNLKTHIASIDSQESIHIYIAEQYLLINLDDKNSKWIEVRPNKTYTRLEMKTCNLQLDNTFEFNDNLIDIHIKQYTNVQELLDFIVDSLAKSMINVE